MIYSRETAIKYAHKYAERRNQKFFDFSNFGGDCTNFVSQSVFAGLGIMRYDYPMGWYYRHVNDRAPAWTGVNEFNSFFVKNYGHNCDIEDIEIGDIVDLKFQDKDVFTHKTIIVAIQGNKTPQNILIAAHTNDCDNRPLCGYDYKELRFLHISK